MSTATIVIGPEHHGRTMSLEDFADAEGREGHLYELGRGVITVIDVPNRPHLRQLIAIREQIHGYQASNPGIVNSVCGGGECKVPVVGTDSERHPDIAVYKTHPPQIDDSQLWSVWIPELVIEVVSPGSDDRDYHQKPEEYLQFGVQEYWIVDESKDAMTVHQRSSGQWDTRTVSPGKKYKTHLLPGFEFDLQRVFDAVRS
ncbi:MAG: Uma2 family endonuclease [Planctomycetaceae bacterium]